ncbi:cytochrome P450 [Pisolithus orientalis]|uniref:cytochrome P450 n=1 Tax=Pisolithus orientalis TaxID=936130 RepID=UPI0022245002|nr:cytochrome P450 [Pisolithus orientalis]KAI6002625.1 cytochrome P450 [Pisolithus orientalis]
MFESFSLVHLTVVGVFLALGFFKVTRWASSRNSLPLPPGPPARWFWQNPLPRTDIARTLADWVNEYGPVISLQQGRQVTIIVGRMDAVTEIMEKNGASTADRPHSIAARELLSKGLRMVLEHNNERHRRLRKAMSTHLQPKSISKFRPMQMQDARRFVLDVLNDPGNHQTHTLRYGASVILRVTYGKSTSTSNDDAEVIGVHTALGRFQRVMRPGAYLVDRVPILKHVPWYGREIEQWHRYEIKLFREQLARVQREMETTDCGPSFARTLLEHELDSMPRDEMAYLAGSMYGAGSETSAVGLMSMIVAAACHPDAQLCVQNEIDAVVGRDQAPNWNDADSLPQLQAFILETARWRPVIPHGFGHRVTKDIIWRGYLIPAGAVIYGCLWAISRDSDVFPEPDEFNPQRWLDHNGRIRTDLKFYPYGQGRRVCPGMYLANDSLFMTMASLLWSFRIVERPDAPIDVDAYTDTLISRPYPCKVDFIPRLDVKVLRAMMEAEVGE